MPPRSMKNYYNPAPAHITASLPGQAGQTGGALSSRLSLTVRDETGAALPGFFTENDYVNEKRTLHTLLDRQVREENLDTRGLEPLRRVFETTDRSYIKIVQDFMKIAPPTQDIEPENLTLERAFRNPFRLQELEAKLVELGLSKRYLDIQRDDPAFQHYLDVIYRAMYNAGNIDYTHVSHHGQTQETNINLRNNAMYDYAAGLGIPNAVARSVPMTLLSDGNVRHGSFMVNAKGIRHGDWSPAQQGFGNKDIVITGSAVRELSNLQVLDFLCGNVDRHLDNLFYSFDTTDPDHVRLVGVQGIDNDASFGVVDYKGEGVYDRMSRLDDILVIDDDLARKVLTMTHEEMEAQIRRAGLSEREINAANERLDALKSRIRKGNIERIGQDVLWNRLATPAGMRELANLVPDAELGNIFANMTIAIEEYNQEKPIQELPLPKSPEALSLNRYDKYDLWDQITSLRRLRRELDAAGSAMENTRTRPVAEQLDRTLEHMVMLSGKDMLSNDERQFLTDDLAALKDLTARYIADNPSRRHTHAVKNLDVYAKAAGVRLARTAEAPLSEIAAPAAPEAALPEMAPETVHTPESLRARIAQVDSRFIRSSDEFKELLRSLNVVDQAHQSLEKQRELAERLLDSAQTYLNHKAPNGNTEGLSRYALNRLQFARDVAEFAEVRLDAIAREAAAQPVQPAPAENPTQVVITGFGDAMEYDPQNGVYVCFDNREMEPERELLERMTIRNGGEPLDEDQLEAYNRIVESDYGHIVDAISISARQTEERLAREERAFRESHAARRFPPLEPIAEEPEEAPEQVPELPHADLSQPLAPISEELLEDDERTGEQIMQAHYKYAYELIGSEQTDFANQYEAVLTVLVCHGLKPTPGLREPLTPEQTRREERRAAMLNQLGENPEYMNELTAQLHDALAKTIPEGKLETYVAEAIEGFRNADRLERNGESGMRYKQEQVFADLHEELMKERTIRPASPRLADAFKVVESVRRSAYDVLRNMAARPEERDEALITIAACHELTQGCRTERLAQSVWQGKRSPDSLTFDACRKINEFNRTMDAIGRDPKCFFNFREARRAELAPFFGTRFDSLARMRVREAEPNCLMARTKQDLFRAEGQMLDLLESYSHEIGRKSRTIGENYLRQHPIRKYRPQRASAKPEKTELKRPASAEKTIGPK